MMGEFVSFLYSPGATLISNDEHLLGWRDRLDLPIVAPGEFRKELPRDSRGS